MDPRPALTDQISAVPARVALLCDAELEGRLKRLALVERGALVLLLAHLGEFDQRRLYADRGHSSLFKYCTVLGYSEQAAYKRIQAARTARDHPQVLEHLAAGRLHLAAVVVLAPHLRPENASGLLAFASGKPTRELERLAAGLSPRHDSADYLRALPVPAGDRQEPLSPAAKPESLPASMGGHRDCLSPGGDHGVQEAASRPAHGDAAVVRPAPVLSPGPEPRERVEPLSQDRFLFRFTAGDSFRQRYLRAKELLSAACPKGGMEAVLGRALDELLRRIDPELRHARRMMRKSGVHGTRAIPPARESPGRHVPSAIRDAVWVRDKGQCTFVGPNGRRCPETSGLEVDHVVPVALGGVNDDPQNLRLACRAHNQLRARRVFGALADRRRRKG